MSVPEVVSVGELRLDDAVTQLQGAEHTAVFVGHRDEPEAVLVSAARYARLVAEERGAAVDSAIGSVRAEGLPLTTAGVAMLREVAAGTLSIPEARAQILARYQP